MRPILSSQTNPSGVRRHFFCRWIIWVLDVNLLILWKVLIFYQLKFVSKRGAKRWTCGRQQRTWSENVTSRFCNHSSVIHCHYACKMCYNYPGTKLEPALQKSNICHHILTSSTQLQNRSFHVVERKRTSAKCQKTKNARAKHAKLLFVYVKYANSKLPLSSWLRKLPITSWRSLHLTHAHNHITGAGIRQPWTSVTFQFLWF